MKIMKLFAMLVVTLVAAWLLAGCGADLQNIASDMDTVEGSGNVIREPREVSGFTEVALTGIGNLTIRHTGSESLTIEAEDNIIPELTTEVENGRLTLGVEPNTDLRPTEPINYELTVKDLNALQTLGAGEIDASSINTDNLEIASSGSGEISVANVEANNLKVTSAGSGEVKTAGRVDSQAVDISGSGRYQAEDLESQEAKVDVEGAGEATVNVTDKLDVSITGSGSVEYVGDPTISQEVRGSGELRRR
jgi:hypothetical protein